MARRVRGILFDLGDTLLDFGSVDIPSVFEAGAVLAHEYLTREGFDPPSLAKYHRRQLWAIRWNYLKSRFTRREFNSLDLLGRLNARTGRRPTDRQMLELAWLWYRPLSEQATVEDGLGEMLDRLRDRGLALGVVSNTFVPGEVLDRHLEQAGLLDKLPVRVYSCDVSYRKPNPNIFRIALERCRLEAPETMFVGNSPKADIRGANRMGMVSVLKDPTGRHEHDTGGADHCIAALAEVENLLRRHDAPDDHPT
jgi:putative hydrolase of the HAD superfamily